VFAALSTSLAVSVALQGGESQDFDVASLGCLCWAPFRLWLVICALTLSRRLTS
jgi:hypothetical protein